MACLYKLFESVDVPLTNWMAHYGILFLRVSLGVVFLVRCPKILPRSQFRRRLGNSYHERADVWVYPDTYRDPASGTMGMSDWAGAYSRRVHAGNLTIAVATNAGHDHADLLFPAGSFRPHPYTPTLEGQYIIKNIVLISAGIVIGATARGGRMVADPHTCKPESISS